MDCYIDPLNPANNLFRPFPSPLVRTSGLRLGPRIPHKRRTKTVALHHMPSKGHRRVFFRYALRLGLDHSGARALGT